LQAPQFGTGLNAQLLDEDATAVSEHRQRLGPPAAPVKRQHELAAEPLPQRVLTHQPGKLSCGLGMAAKREHDIGAFLDRGQPLLAKPDPLDLGPRARNPGQRGRLP
jgi:hypothetical protein